LAAAMVEDPRALGQALFAKQDLTPALKKTLEGEVQRRTMELANKVDQAQATSLLLFALSNNLSSDIQAKTLALFSGFLKTMKKSAFYLTDGITDYPLGSTATSARDLCQAHIQAYRLVNRDLSFKNRNIQMDAGRVTKIEDAAHFCQQKDGLLEVLSQVTSSEGGNAYVVTGKFENTDFKFVAVNTETLRPQVEDFAKKNLASWENGIDDILFSVNGSAPSKMTNSQSYWRTPSEIASALIAGVEAKGLLARDEMAKQSQVKKMAVGKAHRIEVIAEGSTLNFGVNTVEDMAEQCELVKARFDGKDIDDLSVAVDGSTPVKFNNSQSYWRTGKEICQLIRRGITGKVLSKISAAVVAKKSSSRYTFDVILEGIPLTFAVNSYEEVIGQCKSLVDDVGLGDVDDVKIQMKGQQDRSFTNGQSYWRTTAEICSIVSKHMFGAIPSKEQTSVLSLKRKYKIVSTFQGLPVAFNVNDSSELKSQCLTILKSLPLEIDSIIYSVNGSSQQKFYNSSSYWRGAEENCNVVSANIRLP